MAIFKGIKDNWKKSEAAVVIQNLLEDSFKIGLFEMDPASSANSLIGTVWTKFPHLFDGRFGQRPHKISIAAYALANALEVVGADNSNGYTFAISLGKILNEIDLKGNLYPFSSLDKELFESAAQTFMKFSDALIASPFSQKISNSLRSEEVDWEYWYAVYREEAGKVNSELSIKSNGLSLIDFMDDEPLRRAYRDKVEPRSLARIFAKQFDISKMRPE
jgi:hypothetical protein